MSRLTIDLTLSLDGYVAGPNQSVENPLGEGGADLHGWAFAVRTFREAHGMEGGTTFHFVTEGIEAALEQARAAAGGKDVHVAGGAEAAQQYLKAGLADTLQVHVAPMLLGSGTRLLDGLGDSPPGLALDRVIASPAVTHLRYRVAR